MRVYKGISTNNRVTFRTELSSLKQGFRFLAEDSFSAIGTFTVTLLEWLQEWIRIRTRFKTSGSSTLRP
jgi:hypothetical protein